MTAYANLQEAEFAPARDHGYSAVRHQRFVGIGYFDALQQAVSGGSASTTALEGSTETGHFSPAAAHTGDSKENVLAR